MTPVALPGAEDPPVAATFSDSGDLGGVEDVVEGGVVDAGVVADWSDSDVFPPSVFIPSCGDVERGVDAGGKIDRVTLGTLASVTATPVEGTELFASSGAVFGSAFFPSRASLRSAALFVDVMVCAIPCGMLMPIVCDNETGVAFC